MADLLAPWGHGDILAWGAAKGHVWVLTQPQLWSVLRSMAPATTKVQEDRTAQRVGLAPLLDTIVKLALPLGTSLENVSTAELAPRLVCHLVARPRERCPPHPSPFDADKTPGSREQESWASPSWAAALRRASPAPRVGSTVELTCWQGHCKLTLRA